MITAIVIFFNFLFLLNISRLIFIWNFYEGHLYHIKIMDVFAPLNNVRWDVLFSFNCFVTWIQRFSTEKIDTDKPVLTIFVLNEKL